MILTNIRNTLFLKYKYNFLAKCPINCHLLNENLMPVRLCNRNKFYRCIECRNVSTTCQIKKKAYITFIKLIPCFQKLIPGPNKSAKCQSPCPNTFWDILYTWWWTNGRTNKSKAISPPLNRLRMSYCDHLPSAVCMSTPLNHLSSETLEPIFFKLHVEPSIKRRLKIYSNGHGPLIKVAVMPKYAKK